MVDVWRKTSYLWRWYAFSHQEQSSVIYTNPIFDRIVPSTSTCSHRMLTPKHARTAPPLLRWREGNGRSEQEGLHKWRTSASVPQCIVKSRNRSLLTPGNRKCHFGETFKELCISWLQSCGGLWVDDVWAGSGCFQDWSEWLIFDCANTVSAPYSTAIPLTESSLHPFL